MQRVGSGTGRREARCFGYAKEYHVERLLREVTLTRIAPITEQLILSFIAEKVLDLPKSY